MTGQSKISSFFTSMGKKTSTKLPMTSSVKRTSEEFENKNGPPHKKLSTGLPHKQLESRHPSMDAVGLEFMGESWKKALNEEFKKEYFTKLCKLVASERKSNTVFPPVDEVFSWTRHCSVSDVKVVILGQDPYHDVNQAHGLCFSVKRPVKPPPSLENMFKELKNDIKGFKHPQHGDLTGWAKQGVLLLNAVLTVRAHCANSHKDKGWEKLTDAVIKYISSHHKGVVFLLWGAYAQKKGAVIDKTKHHILKCVHPSPLSAHRGFFGCKHFSKTNAYLKEQGCEEINWCDL